MWWPVGHMPPSFGLNNFFVHARPSFCLHKSASFRHCTVHTPYENMKLRQACPELGASLSRARRACRELARSCEIVLCSCRTTFQARRRSPSLPRARRKLVPSSASLPQACRELAASLRDRARSACARVRQPYKIVEDCRACHELVASLPQACKLFSCRP